MHRCIAWDKVKISNPQSTPQVLPSFEENTPSVTYPDKVEEIIGILFEVEPLDETPLEDLGLNTCNHDIPLSFREILNFVEPEPQPQPFPSFTSLEVDLGEERDPKPPIKPPSLDSFKMKEVDHLTNHTPPSPHVASFHLKNLYCYYHPCIDNPKRARYHNAVGSGVNAVPGVMVPEIVFTRQQTDSQPKRSRLKHMSKKSKGKETESTGDVTLRWSSDEEASLTECYVAVSEDRNVGRSQAKDTFWVRVMHEFNRKNFQKRTKDMLTSKWSTLNHHCQKFNAIYKRCHRLKKNGENEVDLMGRARVMYQDESRNSLFNHDKAWAILRQHAKWDAPEVAPIDLTEDGMGDFHATVNTDELFGADPRPRPPGKQRLRKKTKSDTSASTGGSQSSQFGEFISHELRLKREVAEKAFEALKDKDETIKSLEELRFLALSTKDLLYLTRRSLKVLRKFHWMILGERFNQLSHVSSPLLSKPEEY
nr:hypothetical protein [Tanacetum cinerariifolium]